MAMNPRLLVPRTGGIASPLVISGCVGWYDSLDLTAMAQNSDGTGAVAAGDQVGWWKDKSPTGATVTQGIAANRPTLTGSKVFGRAALTFDGSNDNLSKSSYTAQNSLAGLTRILILDNVTFAGGYITRVFNGGGDGLNITGAAIRQYVSADTNFTFHATPSGSNALSLGIYSFRYGSSAMSLRIGGASVAGTVNGTIPATTGAGTPTLHIGSNIGVNSFYNGTIAEYIIYNRALSDAELRRVESYLKKKWGL
jgi:hypothetical protein